MTRTITVSRNHRILFVAAALIPLTLMACSEGGSRSPQSATAGANTPGVVNTSFTPGASPATEAAVSRVPAVVSYADAELVYREGRYQEAERLFETYTTSNPANQFGHYMLGLSAWKAGDFSAADRAFNRAIELDSTHVKSYLNSARVLLDLDRNHEALERAERARGLDESSTDALRLVARAYHSMGQVDSAVEAYHQALALDGSDVWSMNNLGVLYLDIGQPEQALAPLARAVQLRGTSPVFQNNLGLALERTGHLTGAKAAYGAALRADSTYSKAAISLARVNVLEVDSTDTVSVDDLAEEFRIQAGMWRETSVQPIVDTVQAPAPVSDSISNQ
ncbi:MAG: tetratricopeptide repeat protein [Gemmatimonadota bacterium]